MNTTAKNPPSPDPVILLIDDDVIARTAVAAYLRECGYQVVETNNEDDGRKMLQDNAHDIDIAICAIHADNAGERFGFSQWARANHPNVRVLIAATLEKTARLAADICEEGPQLRKPYEHQALLDWIKRLRT